MFDKLFGKTYPSSGWQRRAALSLEVDLDRGTLCGVGLGRNMDDFAFLGPADEPEAARTGVLCYLSLGLEVRTEGGLVHEISLILADSLGDGYEPFQGSITWKGRMHILSAETAEEEAVRLFGAPARRSETRDEESGDLDELALSYSSGDITWELVFGPGGTLQEVWVTRPVL